MANEVVHRTGNEMKVKPINQSIFRTKDFPRSNVPSIAQWVLRSFFMIALSLSVTNVTHAQSIAESFGGFSKKNNEPIKIEADTLEVLDDKKIAIFSGNVKVVQGKFQLVSKKLKVTYSGGVGGKNKKEAAGIKQIDATGKVAINTPDNQSATSDWAKFDVLAKIVTIGGNVVLSQSGNVMRGDTLVIDLNTGRSKFHSTTKASGQKPGKRPRISGVFFPGKNKQKKLGGGSVSKKSGPANKTIPNQKPPLPWQKNSSSSGN